MYVCIIFEMTTATNKFEEWDLSNLTVGCFSTLLEMLQTSRRNNFSFDILSHYFEHILTSSQCRQLLTNCGESFIFNRGFTAMRFFLYHLMLKFFFN